MKKKKKENKMENKNKFEVIKGSHYCLGYLGKQINCKK